MWLFSCTGIPMYAMDGYRFLYSFDFIKRCQMKVAIFGQKNNGKSTLAKLLVATLNDKIRMNMGELRIASTFQLGAFAKAVKQSVATKFLVPLTDIEEWKNRDEIYPGWTCTMREALQREGEQARQIDPHVWIRKVMAIQYPIVIDDGRYLNEAEAVHASKGYNILIFRPGFENNDEHPSESFVGELSKRIQSKYRSELKVLSNGADPFRFFHEAVCNEGDWSLVSGTADNILAHYRRNHVEC